RVDGEDGHLVMVGKPLDHVDVLAHRVGADHDLDAVVSQARGQFERIGRAFRIYRSGGQCDLRIGHADDISHVASLSRMSDASAPRRTVVACAGRSAGRSRAPTSGARPTCTSWRTAPSTPTTRP